MLNWIDNRYVPKGFEILSSLLLPVYKLSRENTQPENMCNNVFEKAKRRTGKAEVFMQKQPSEGFFKKDVMRNFA